MLNRKSGLRYLADTSATESTSPKYSIVHKIPDTELSLYAANGSKTMNLWYIYVNSRSLFTLKWTFVIAEVDCSILDVDFLQHFGLIVDIKNQRIIDRKTKQSSKGAFAFGKSLGLKAVSSISIYHKQPQKLPFITDPALLNVTRKPYPDKHTILTKSPPFLLDHEGYLLRNCVWLKRNLNSYWNKVLLGNQNTHGQV